MGEEQPGPSRCDTDAMLVFDGSGSMAGNERLGIGSVVTRIDKVRKALDRVLPAVTPNRKIGLVTYGPGPYNRCDNIELNLRPAENAAGPIKSAVDAIVPAGRTPLTEAVRQAADVLDYRKKPGVVVLLTDGEETCGGNPCTLAKALKAEAADLTVHVIGYRMKDFSWTGGAGLMDMRCLADATGGYYESPETLEELVASLSKTLGCPELTEHDKGGPFKMASGESPVCKLNRVR
jgi:Ca-activated chloride channel family protein